MVAVVTLVGTLRSDSGDVHENVAEKMEVASFETFSLLSQYPPLLKRREFWLQLKRGDRARIQTEMVEFIASPLPVLK